MVGGYDTKLQVSPLLYCTTVHILHQPILFDNIPPGEHYPPSPQILLKSDTVSHVWSLSTDTSLYSTVD